LNFAHFERAQLARFAYCEAKGTGSLPCIKGICYAIRNRVKAGWGDGTWLSVLESHSEVAGNLNFTWPRLDPADRLLQLIVRDIDDIYSGMSADDTKRVIGDHALYWQFIDRDPRPWFVDNIVRKPTEHPRVAQLGPIAFFK